MEVTATLGNIVCTDFDQAIYDTAMDALLANATFEDAACADLADGSGVSLVSEVRVPLLVIATKYGLGGGMSVHAHVLATLSASVSDGSFTAEIQDAANKANLASLGLRRRATTSAMTSAEAQSVEVATFAPSPAPSGAPTSAPSPAPTAAPFPAPTATPGNPSAVPIPAPTSLPVPAPTLPRPAPLPTPRPIVQVVIQKDDSSDGTMTLVILIVVIMGVTFCGGIICAFVMFNKTFSSPQSNATRSVEEASHAAMLPLHTGLSSRDVPARAVPVNSSVGLSEIILTPADQGEGTGKGTRISL